MPTDKEKKREYDKKRYEKIKQEKREHDKEYYKNNRERIIEKQKEYEQSVNGIKLRIIGVWKRSGLVCDDYNELYDKYIIAENCEECNVKFEERNGMNKRCMDHDHTTGLFRNFLCRSCNLKRC
jgi:hypothetical protein